MKTTVNFVKLWVSPDSDGVFVNASSIVAFDLEDPKVACVVFDEAAAKALNVAPGVWIDLAMTVEEFRAAIESGRESLPLFL